jgi:hypothetical protein
MAATAVPIQSSRNQLQAWFEQKATTDPVFRRNLLANPTLTLGGLFGKQVPPGIKVIALEETATDVYLVHRYEGSMEPFEANLSQAILMSRAIHALAMSEEAVWDQIKANPKQFVTQRLGMQLGPSVVVHAVEEDANTIYLVLHNNDHYANWTPPQELMQKIPIKK